MTISVKQLELIEKYLGNRLTDDEKVSFESNLSFQEFRDELLLQAKLVDAASDAVDRDLISYLNNYEQPERTRFLSEPLMKYAAVILLLIAAVIVFNLKSESFEINHLALIENYNFTFPAEIVERGEADEMSPEYKNALSHYANGQYQESISAFSNIMQPSEKTNLYLANAYIELNDFKKAIEILEHNFIEVEGTKIELSTSSILQNREWYLAIAQLGIGKTKEAKEAFKEMANSQDHLFKEKAEEILKEF